MFSANGLSQPAGAVAIAPLSGYLPESVQAQLTAPNALNAQQREAHLGALARVHHEAIPEVELETVQALEDLTVAGEDALAERVLAQRYKALRRMAAERALANARISADRWLKDFHSPQASDDAVFATPDGTASVDPLKLQRPLALPPSRFYDKSHWSKELIPDQNYAQRLSVAASLFATADKEHSSEKSTKMKAQDDLLAPLRIKNQKIYSHAIRVSLLAGLIAWKMGLPMDFALKVTGVARLHDIGKSEDVVLSVINKEGKLTPEERAVMQRHTTIGADIIAAAPDLDIVTKRAAWKVAFFHHATMDGMGYPQVLSAKNIPLESRITTIADCYDALMENRPYRLAMTDVEALKTMEGMKKKFDPAAWKSFKALLDERLEL